MSKNISDLREALFATLQGVKDGSVDIERARAINELGESAFIDTAVGDDNLPPGITGRTVHRLKG